MDSLFEQMQSNKGLIFRNTQFQDFLEMNMADLRKVSRNSASNIELADTQKVRADRNFNLLCNMVNIPYYLHWVTMRVNGLKRPSDFRYNMQNLIEVDRSKLDALILQFQEAQSIT